MGTPGHMQHPFDVPSVQTGQDLINYFGKIAAHLTEIPGSVKIDGINVSFKLVTNEDGQKDFRMDRGTSFIQDVIGMTAQAAKERWTEGHGMPIAIKTLLEIFNEAIPSIEPELKKLGMWDDPTKFFNTEYVSGKTNVQAYDKNFLAIHGINQFYEKKAQAHRIRKGDAMDRPGLERPMDPDTQKPIKGGSTEIDYDKAALDSLIEKVQPIAEEHGFEIYGDIPTAFVDDIEDIEFGDSLNSIFSIQMTAEQSEDLSLREWLETAQDPGDAKVTLADGRQVPAIGKEVYLAIVRDHIPLMEYLTSDGNQKKDVELAISGAVFNHATRLMGNDIKRALTSSLGSLMGHEGVVVRGLEDKPVKVTGDFIIGGLETTFEENLIREQQEEELEFEIVDGDETDKTKTALIPGGFKPPHRGHLTLVSHYLDEVGPDGKVIIFMGGGGKTPRTIHGSPVTYENALKVWQIYLENEGIPFPHENLEIREIEGGPVGRVVDYVTEADPDSEIIYLGAGEKDGERWKFMLDNPKYNPNGVDVFVEAAPNYIDSEGKPMSATNFRNAIESGDEELIKSYIPDSSYKNYEEIIDSLSSKLEESQLPLGIFLRLIEEVVEEATVEQAFGSSAAYLSGITNPGSGKRDDDEEDEEDEEELEEISAMGAGAVEGYAGGRRRKRGDDEEESLIREIEDYLFSTLGVDS